MQRALMQYFMPNYAPLARKALKRAHREDLIGFSKDALLPPRDIHRPAEKAGKNAGTEKQKFIKENRPKQTNHKKSQKRP